MSIEMKGITCCGDCVYYSYKKHKCTRGCKNYGSPQSHFYEDCPLPSVVVDKYKWHDLRKNPEDLPKNTAYHSSTQVLFCDIDHNYYIGRYFCLKESHYRARWCADYNDYRVKNVIAWREIEPLEEE